MPWTGPETLPKSGNMVKDEMVQVGFTAGELYASAYSHEKRGITIVSQ